MSQFETALVNTAVNARDAMRGEGESAIRIAREQPLPAIRVHAGAAGPFVAVSVIDEGCGIPMDRVSRIFEPFFTLKEDGKGIGLGLSQVIGFAEQSGGDVDVSSAVGRGHGLHALSSGCGGGGRGFDLVRKSYSAEQVAKAFRKIALPGRPRRRGPT